uniref:Uncharacterized protein n=1 Tax=Spongospora subterranea TaxID=70186 RepID=A0A0H5R509_9EUKA|eukprot:CRZ09270.1 hypothetical protein [Spongospora subterranea]
MELEQLQSLLAGTQNPGASSNEGLVSCRAGILTQQGSTITADSRKGKLVLIERDGLLHFQWKLRNSDDVQEDYIVMPGEATIEIIPECTDGRVIFVNFPSDPSRKHFYWLQEPKVENDAALIEKFRSHLNRAAGTQNSSSVNRPNQPTSGGLDQSQLLALLTGNAPAQAATRAPVQNLAEVLNPDRVIPLLQSDPDLVSAVLPDLPEGERTREALYSQLRSPQLQQTLQRLTAAINSGQGQTLLRQLGLPVGDDIGVDALLQALLRNANNRS